MVLKEHIFSIKISCCSLPVPFLWFSNSLIFYTVIVPLCAFYSVGYNCPLTEWATGNSCIIPVSKCSTKTGSTVICYQSGISSYSFWNIAASAINIDWSKNHPLRCMHYTGCYLALPFRMFDCVETWLHFPTDILIYVKLLVLSRKPYEGQIPLMRPRKNV